MQKILGFAKNIELSKKNFLFLFLAIIFSIAAVLGLRENIYLTFIVIGFLFLALILINDFRLSIFLILFSIIFGQILRIPLTSFGGSVIASDVIILLVGASWLFKKLINKEGFIKTPINIYLLLFMFAAAISTIYSFNLFNGGEIFSGSLYFFRWVLYLATFFIVIDFVKTEGSAKRYLNWTIAAAVIIAFLGFAQMIFVPNFSFMSQYGWDPHQFRLLSTFFDPNLLGVFLNLVLAVVFSLFLSAQTKKEKLYLGISSLVILAAIILTFSRSAYLGLLIVVFLTTISKSWKFTLGAVLIILLIFFSIPKAAERIQKAFAPDRSSQARIISWQEGWQVISKHPFIGIGFNNIPSAKIQNSEDGEIVHSASGFDSSLLTIWAVIGIFGLIFYLAIYFGLIWQGFKNYLGENSVFAKSFGLGFAIGLVAIFAESQFINGLLFPPIMIAVWFLAGLMFASDKISQKMSSTTLDNKHII